MSPPVRSRNRLAAVDSRARRHSSARVANAMYLLEKSIFCSGHPKYDRKHEVLWTCPVFLNSVVSEPFVPT